MRRLVSTVHGVLTAATVTGALAVHGLGAWLTLALGHRPRPCVDDIQHWSFQVASWTTGLLMAVAYFGLLLLLPTTLIEVCIADRRTWARHALGLRLALVVLAWTSLMLDPLGGWQWFLD
jgi:hypothetical protein